MTEMKLSEELIELAEWCAEVYNISLPYGRPNHHMAEIYGFDCYLMEHMHGVETREFKWDASAYLCLFEAELQKDIECLNKMLAIVHS